MNLSRGIKYTTGALVGIAALLGANREGELSQGAEPIHNAVERVVENGKLGETQYHLQNAEQGSRADPDYGGTIRDLADILDEYERDNDAVEVGGIRLSEEGIESNASLFVPTPMSVFDDVDISSLERLDQINDTYLQKTGFEKVRDVNSQGRAVFKPHGSALDDVDNEIDLKRRFDDHDLADRYRGLRVVDKHGSALGAIDGQEEPYITAAYK